MSRSRGGPAGVTADLQRLRWRLTGIFTASATAVLVLFVLLLLSTSTQFERRRLDSDLMGAASRATALVYDDEDDGRTRVEGVADDDLASSGLPLVVVEQDPSGAVRVLLDLGAPDRPSALALARRAVGEPADRGVFGTVVVRDEPRRAVALSWSHDDDRPGGAVVVVAPGAVALTGNRLLLPAAAGGLGVLALLAMLTWVLAGRSLRPAVAAISDRERFLSTAAHELRGPVARLRAGAEAARRAVRPQDPVARALDQLVSVADGAAHVVSNLLLATRAEHGDVPVRRRPVDLAALAGDLELAHPSVLVDITGPVVVDGDPALLRHALDNLVDNSIRHGRVGDALPTVEVVVRQHRGRAVVRVTDDGPGFPPDVDVLARYAVGATGGTGLGLPLVSWIMERHDGHLTLGPGARTASWTGAGATAAGATVQLDLPLAPPVTGATRSGGHVHEARVVALERDDDRVGGAVAVLGDDEVGLARPR